MHKRLLDAMTWVLFLGGVFGLGAALVSLFAGDAPVRFGTLGVGGGFWLLCSAITIWIQQQIRPQQ